jgi:N-acetylmuramoyl-L-alanine amidase
MEGSETYYYKPRDYPLAEALHQALLEKLKRKDNFIRRAKFYVLTHTKVPAVLIEPVYLSNEKELKLSLDPEFQKQTALAVVDGLVNYFGKLKRKGKK